MTHVTQTLIHRREYRSFHDLNHARLGVKNRQTHDLQMQQGMPKEPPTQTHKTETLMEIILKAIHMAHNEAILTALQVCASRDTRGRSCAHTAQHLAALQVRMPSFNRLNLTSLLCSANKYCLSIWNAHRHLLKCNSYEPRPHNNNNNNNNNNHRPEEFTTITQRNNVQSNSSPKQ